jgi:hypothetical protein
MSRFLESKRFAFAIFDDTGLSTIANISPVCQLLNEYGIAYDTGADAHRVSPVARP